jgi:hypothetical protein
VVSEPDFIYRFQAKETKGIVDTIKSYRSLKLFSGNEEELKGVLCM